MRLRYRLALVFALTASIAAAVALFTTVTVFRHAQERQLDQELLVRAWQRALLIALQGEQALHLEVTPIDEGRDLDFLVQYAALYRLDGTVVQATPNLGNPPPSLAEIGYRKDLPLPQRRLEFSRSRLQLRGVLVKVGGPAHLPPRLLLLAAPRGDADADVRHLVKLMLVVLGALVVSALLAGGFLGRYLSRGIELVAKVARQVSEGDMKARVGELSSLGAKEVQTLSMDLNRMIGQLDDLLVGHRRFISHAAHELRSPLTVLRGELELALHRPRDVSEYRSAVQRALADTERLIALAEDLLVLARLESARPTEHRPLILRELIDEAIWSSAVQSQQAVGIAIEADSIELRGNRSDLVRLLRNLVDNAISHAPSGSTVKILGSCATGSYGKAQQACILVIDEGPGVPQEIRDRIFEPFFRGANERERSGAGLGLAIAHQIARQHQGSLRLLPTDKGATFEFRMPIY